MFINYYYDKNVATTKPKEDQPMTTKGTTYTTGGNNDEAAKSLAQTG